jgi:Protein of unknown function (DUF3224)
VSFRAEGIYETQDWSEEAHLAANDEKMSLARVHTYFGGDITGEGAAQYLMIYTGRSHGNFVGLERIIGSLGGRTGSFVIKSEGTFGADSLEANWSVVPGSGREDFAGIRGAGTYSWRKEQDRRTLFGFEYELE